MTIDLGKGIFGTATYLVVTIVDKHGKEHIGRIPDKNETRRVIKGSKRKE